jgi:hypothetical protein
MTRIACLLTGLATALVPLAAAAEDCRAQLGEVSKLARESPRVDLERRQLNRLREVALYLAQSDREAACLELAGAMERIVRERRDVLQRTDAIARFATAPRITELGRPLAASEITGSVVRGPTGEEIGEIRDLVLRPGGDVAYAVVHYGEFIGLGGTSVAVDWSALRLTEDGSTYVLRATEQDLEAVPGLDGKPWPAAPPGLVREAPAGAAREGGGT